MQVYVYTAYLDSVVDSLPATPTKLKQIKSAQTSDDICKRLSRYIANGWPRHRREQLLYYWPNQSVLHEKRGLLMKGERLIIPECMRPDIKGSTTAKQTIARFKAVFARYGCPEVLVTDNGPQFFYIEFAQFAQDYDFTHVTSPCYPHSNGEAERAIRTVKSLLAKEGQLLMGRRIRTPVPVSPEQLQPQWPDLDKFREKDIALKLQQEQTFNRRHRTQTLPSLQPGQNVWIKPTSTKGTVVNTSTTPHSYEVETLYGRRLRRNSSHLRKVPGASCTR
ncbi:uncharacterized protein K02A2.6-like [Tachysurus ichikawai]